MIVAGPEGYEVPDSCPANCRFLGEPFYQGCVCTRCPVFICRTHPVDPETGYAPVVLVEPDDYRPDWARVWVRFFAGDVEYPELPLKMEDD